LIAFKLARMYGGEIDYPNFVYFFNISLTYLLFEKYSTFYLKYIDLIH